MKNPSPSETQPLASYTASCYDSTTMSKPGTHHHESRTAALKINFSSSPASQPAVVSSQPSHSSFLQMSVQTLQWRPSLTSFTACCAKFTTIAFLQMWIQTLQWRPSLTSVSTSCILHSILHSLFQPTTMGFMRRVTTFTVVMNFHSMSVWQLQ